MKVNTVTDSSPCSRNTLSSLVTRRGTVVAAAVRLAPLCSAKFVFRFCSKMYAFLSLSLEDSMTAWVNMVVGCEKHVVVPGGKLNY